MMKLRNEIQDVILIFYPGIIMSDLKLIMSLYYIFSYLVFVCIDLILYKTRIVCSAARPYHMNDPISTICWVAMKTGFSLIVLFLG